MIYLNNNTIIQELYIPRQDYIYNPTGSGGTYAEGYADGFESGYTSGSTDGFDSGYTEGYSSGETHQKGLLSSTTFTENGEYERENGWSAITVNVEPSLEEINVVISADTTTITPSSGYDGFSAATIDASGYAQENYDSGFDDGFTDGYSSGASEGYDSGYTEGYQSGSTDGYESGYTSGTTDGYGSGYTSGYTSGHTDGIDEQKALLTTTALTENGSYQRENGWSGVTVNVDTASTYNSGYTSGYTDGYDSGYTSGNTDGFNSGYTSGETHQKSLLGTTAFTINGSYSAENGYSAITVNVPTGETYNIEQNKPFTATSNGNYTITPSNASTSVSGTYNNDNYTISISFNEYPQEGNFSVLDIKDYSNLANGYINVYYLNGMPYSQSVGWSGGTIFTEERTATLLRLRITNANENFGWEKCSDYLEAYDVMSAVSLNVNVDTASTYQSGYTSGHTDGVSEEKAKLSATTITANTAITISDGGYSAITVNVPQTGSTNVVSLVDSIYTQSMDWDSSKYIDTMVTATTATTMRIGYVGANIGSDRVIGYDWMDTGVYDQGWRYFNGYNDTNTVDLINSRKQGGSPTRQNGVTYDITLGNNYLYDNINETYLVSQSDVKSSLPRQHSILVDVGSQKVKFVEIKDNGVTLFYGQAAIDNDGNIGLYDSISQSMFYNSGLSMTYDGTPVPISQDYQSGYTDGQNSIINTFTAATATTNGVYGSSASPLSSITVNVPQTGSSSVLGVGSFSANGTYSASTDNLDGYSAITIDVPQSGGGVKYIEYIQTDGTKYGWEIPLQIGYNSVIEMDFMPLAGRPNSDGWYSFFGTNGNSSNLTTYWGGYNLNDVGGNFLGVEYSPRLSFTSGTRYLFELDNTGVRVDNVQVSTVTNVSQSSSSSTIYINSANDFVRSPIARYYGFKVYDNGTLVWDLRPCLDSNNNPCFYETISEEYYYHTKFDSSQNDPTAGPLLPTEDYLSGYTDGMAYQKSLLGDFTATTNGSFSAENGYSGITVLVPQTSSFGDLYCLYCDNDCIFDFPYTINNELASIDDIHFSALPLSDFTIVYKGDLDVSNYKIGNMKWTDEGNGYYHFSGNWETNYNTYSTNDSTSRAINDFPNMHFFDWKIYATKTYSVDSDDLTILSGGGAPTHTSDLSISGNSYYLGNVSVDNQYCLWYVAVDSDGNGCLRMGNEYKYPRQGNCYPVYRKLVNGTYIYRIVKPANESSSSSTSSDIDKLIDKSITSIDMSSGVTSIGEYVFRDCVSLSSVTIGSQVTYIGDYAFYNCSGMTFLSFGNSIYSIGQYAFAKCSSLVSSLVIPDTVANLSSYAFSGCGISSVTISSSVNSIKSSAFNSCANLNSVTLKCTSLINILASAFKNCSSLSTIYVYSTNAPSLNSSAFQGVPSNGTVHYPQGSDYSSWQSNKYLSGWTFVGDL